jgi:hypothetical protein
MPHPLGTTDFFALEAGECLGRLERLCARPEGVPGDEFVRQVRLLRGAALMAHLQPVAKAGAAFEALARAVRDGDHPWDARTREHALAVVEDFRALVRRAGSWTDADTARANRLATDLAFVAGTPVPGTPLPAPREAAAGVRAFVAREGALLAGALERAAHGLADAPGARAPLDAVHDRMQSLRGLAEPADFPPLHETLEAVELVLADAARGVRPPTASMELLSAGALALAALARGIAAEAPADAEAPEVRHFADQLLRALGQEDPGIVPIETLFRDGDPAPIVATGATPPPAPGGIELVSRGEHLQQAADRLLQARSGTERDLRLAGLVGALRTLEATGGGLRGLATFAAEARQRVADGRAGRAPQPFAEFLRRAGALLRRAGEGPVPATAWAEVMAAATDVVPIAALAFAPAAPAAAGRDGAAVPIAALLAAPAPPPEPSRPLSVFEASVASYRRRLAREGGGVPSLDALLGAPAAPAAAAPAPAEDAVVAITDLCYQGPAALRRAAEIRADVQRRLHAGDEWTALRPLLEELLDLVPLALDRA